MTTENTGASITWRGRKYESQINLNYLLETATLHCGVGEIDI